MRAAALLLSLGLIAGCGALPPDSSSDSDTTPESEDGSDGYAIQTLEEYLEAYCTYAVGCELWADNESCLAQLVDNGPQGCEVVDIEDLNICVDWLSGLSCSEQGWLEECSDAFACP